MSRSPRSFDRIFRFSMKLRTKFFDFLWFCIEISIEIILNIEARFSRVVHIFVNNVFINFLLPKNVVIVSCVGVYKSVAEINSLNLKFQNLNYIVQHQTVKIYHSIRKYVDQINFEFYSTIMKVIRLFYKFERKKNNSQITISCIFLHEQQNLLMRYAPFLWITMNWSFEFQLV